MLCLYPVPATSGGREEIMVRVFDLLHMGSFSEEGGGVRIPYNREELHPGMNLCEDRSVEWPSAIVESVDDESVVLLVGDISPVRVALDYDHTSETVHFFMNGEKRLQVFTLSFFTVRIDEYDIFEDREISFYLDDIQWDKSEEGDPEAAYAIAEEIARQAPEALEIIAKYMSRAMDCGSTGAEAWLRDYHSDDGRWDAYV